MVETAVLERQLVRARQNRDAATYGTEDKLPQDGGEAFTGPSKIGEACLLGVLTLLSVNLPRLNK